MIQDTACCLPFFRNDTDCRVRMPGLPDLLSVKTDQYITRFHLLSK